MSHCLPFGFWLQATKTGFAHRATLFLIFFFGSLGPGEFEGKNAVLRAQVGC